LGFIAASIGPRWCRSLIKIKETQRYRLLQRKSSAAAWIRLK